MVPSRYTSYGIHTDHKLDTRSWIISRHSTNTAPSSHELEIIWSSKRSLDRDNDEIIESIHNRHDSSIADCHVHMPIKGWYLLLTCPSQAFKQAQKQSSFTPGKSYVNLVPSRTHPSIEFKFHLVHLASSSSSSLSSQNDRRSKENNRRRSHVVIETDSDGVPAPAPSSSSSQSLGVTDGSSTTKGWTTFDNNNTGDATPLEPNNPFLESNPIAREQTEPNLKTSTFLLRPINHSIAKSHVQQANNNTAHLSGHGLEKHDHHTTKNSEKRMSLRGIANLFSAADNSFELVWQDDEHNQSAPILIFEDHPSMLHTETSGQLHVMASVMSSEFQMPPAPATQQQQLQQQQQQQMANVTQQQDVFDPITFFVSVGIAYLGFLGDQEAYKAASQG